VRIEYVAWHHRQRIGGFQRTQEFGMAPNEVLALAAAAGIGGFLAWRAAVLLTRWIKGVHGVEPPNLTQRLDLKFNGDHQVVWRLRGGFIYLEDLVKAADARGYRFVGEVNGEAIFERVR